MKISACKRLVSGGPTITIVVLAATLDIVAARCRAFDNNQTITGGASHMRGCGYVKLDQAVVASHADPTDQPLKHQVVLIKIGLHVCRQRCSQNDILSTTTAAYINDNALSVSNVYIVCACNAP